LYSARSLPLLIAAALWGCRSKAPADASSQVSATAQATTGPSGRHPAFAIRVSTKGGVPKLYQLPKLTEWSAPLRGQLPPIDRVVGVDREAAELFVRTAANGLLALDLESGRIDTVASDVQLAALGPDGTLYVVDQNRRVTTLARRVRLTWPHPLQGSPRELFGAANERLLAMVGGERPSILATAADQPVSTRPLPADGDVAASRWGDLIAVASDSGVMLLDPLGQRRAAFVPIDDHPRALVFSPSGHRIYVGSRSGLGLAVIDRYAIRQIDGVALPTPVAALRLDRFGQWLLARPPAGDTVWVVDLTIKRLVGAIASAWQSDLPTVSPNGSLLLRRGADVVALRPDSLIDVGTVAGGAPDLWVTTDWSPRGAAPSREASIDAGAGDSIGAEGPLYVQVSVSRNQSWSQQMADQLSRAGLSAKVLPPANADEGFRVVLGPYGTRAQAEAIGKKLGRPYWIYAPGQ
jgi:hypothetical protein